MQLRPWSIATLLALSACGGTDAIEYEPDDKDVQRNVAPSWEEPGATPPVPSMMMAPPDAAAPQPDAAQPPPDAGEPLPDAAQPQPDAGTDAATGV